MATLFFWLRLRRCGHFRPFLRRSLATVFGVSCGLLFWGLPQKDDRRSKGVSLRFEADFKSQLEHRVVLGATKQRNLQPQHSTQALSPFTATIPGTAVSFEMKPLPAGTIVMADTSLPEGKRVVALKPMWMGKNEVTWDEYDLYAFQLDGAGDPKIGALDAIARPSKPYGAPDRGFGHKGYPALSMTFHAAQEYCRWLSAKTGRKFRLPTALEWEFACRAGAVEKLSKEKLEQQAWYSDNAEDKTHPVATKAPNAWGLHDMLGNVAEWVSGDEGAAFVAGGSFMSKTRQLDCGTRAQQAASWNMTDPQMPKSKWWLSDATFVGFRVVCEP